MAKKRKSSDVNVNAFEILRALTEGDNPLLAPSVKKAIKKNPSMAFDVTPPKNPAAVALGRLGGLKGGKARAAKLSSKKRAEIAKKAATARWSTP